MMNKALVVLIFFSIGCLQKPQKDKLQTSDTATSSQQISETVKEKNYHDSIKKHYDSIEQEVIKYAEKEGIPSASQVSFETKEVNLNILSKRRITIQNPIRIDTVLNKLFGGNTYTVRDGRTILYTSFWRSTLNKPNLSIPSTYIGEEYNITFPSNTSWETRFEDSFYYEMNGIKHCAFFFSSFQSEYDILRTGRFSCAVYGVAVFKYSQNTWTLKNYNPAVSCFGMYGQPQKPIKIRLGKGIFGFIIYDGSSGVGSPIYNNLNLFLLENEIPKVLFIEDVERTYALYSHWKTSVSSKNSQKKYDNLVLNTKGYYNSFDVDSFCIETRHLDTNLYQLINGKNYKFWQERTFVWKQNKFHLSKDNFDFKHIPIIDTIRGNPEDY